MSLEIDLTILKKIEKKLDAINVKADIVLNKLNLIDNYEHKKKHICRHKGEA